MSQNSLHMHIILYLTQSFPSIGTDPSRIFQEMGADWTIGQLSLKYMRDSTIHGVRYISHGSKAAGEVFSWACVFAFIIYNLVVDIGRVYRRDNVIATNIIVRPIEEVPFPAIVIDVGEPIDPLGIVRKSSNVVREESFPSEGMYV